MHTVPTPLGFMYQMTFVPKGARKSRDGLFWGKDVAVFRRIEPDEAEVAFRIMLPEYDAWPLVFPRKPRGKSHGFERHAGAIEVIYYDQSLWWRHGEGEHEEIDDCLSGDNFTQSIEHDRFLFEMLEIDGCHDITPMPPHFREIVSTNYGDKLAQAQRKTFKNFLVCGGACYRRGGMPVYVRNSHHNKTAWEIQVASVGPDRHGDPSVDGLHRHPGGFTDPVMEFALGSGAFWLAGDFANARNSAHRRQTAIPRIDVLMPELVTDIARQTQLDSLFREVVRMFDTPFDTHWNSRPVKHMKARLRALCAPIADDDKLSRQRLELLRELMDEIRNESFWDMVRIREHFLALDYAERLKPSWSSLSDDEADAIACFAPEGGRGVLEPPVLQQLDLFNSRHEV